jgi:acylphosphatase
MPVTQCRFEVFGKVQGVSFRAYTQKKAIALQLVGWCMNTSTGTVVGELQGSTVCSPIISVLMHCIAV